MSTWYKTDNWKDEIKAVEVVKETPQKIIIVEQDHWNKEKTRERGCYKRSQYDNFFSSWQEAKDFLLNKIGGMIDHHQKELSIQITKLEKIEAITEPS